jgi:predicted HTH domain antitoxin
MKTTEKNTTKMTTLNISVPSEIFLTLRENEDQFVSDMKRYTALKLFQNNKLSIGQCAELAGMSEEDFIYFLGENKVSVFEYLDEAMLREELGNA